MKKCINLKIPGSFLSIDETNSGELHWLISFVDWSKSSEKLDNIGVVACCQEKGALIYWADIFSESIYDPLISQPNQSTGAIGSLLVSPIPDQLDKCIVLALSPDGVLWRFCCSPVEISRERISKLNADYAKSLTWNIQNEIPGKDDREFLLLTDHEIQCWKVFLDSNGRVSRLWSRELIDINKDLNRTNCIRLLDMQVDYNGSIIKVLIATLFEGHTQYSLLTLQCRPGYNSSSERILESNSPLHVLIPKGRVEDDECLLSMRLRIGGSPPGSVVIISRKGNATLASNYQGGSAQVHQFELPWDAGKVLDVSSLPSVDKVEGGDWVVLTEKAGLWAIPQTTNINPEESQRSKVSSNDQNSAQDEEAEALLGSLFHNFLRTEKFEGVMEKLKEKGAFEKEGSMNVFARVSQSIVDTLAKHWTTTRGSDILSSAVYSSQLLDKQQKHKRFLQFMALSKCHVELSSRQRILLSFHFSRTDFHG